MTEAVELLIAISGLAVGTFAFRIAGPLLGKGRDGDAESGADDASARPGAAHDATASLGADDATSAGEVGDAAVAGEDSRRGLPAWLDAVMSRAAVVLLIAVVATTALTEEQGFAGIARPAGVLVGGVLAWLKVPFIIVILAAAAVAAGLRLLGVR